MADDGPDELESRIRFAEQAASAGIWEIDIPTDTVRGTKQFFVIMGLKPTEEPVPMSVLRALRLSPDREKVNAGYAKAVETRVDYYESEYPILRNGETRWVLGRGRVIRDGCGRPVRYSGVDIDITERKLAELALADSEKRLRLAVDAAKLAIWEFDIGTAELRNTHNLKRLLGFSETRSLNREALRQLCSPGEQDAVLIAAQAALSAGERFFQVELRFRRPDGEIRWFQLRAEIILNECGEPSAATGVLMDITEQKALSEHRQYLANELEHRTKNILALVQAIAAQTFRKAEEDDRLSVFQARLRALATANELLHGASAGPKDLHELIEGILQPYGFTQERFEIIGPPVSLPSRKNLAMSLALNELATNAAKYGALSSEAGRVEILWDVVDDEARESIVFSWTEREGPPVIQPDRVGFGTRVIRDQLAAEFGGTASLNYWPDGLVFHLRAPLP